MDNNWDEGGPVVRLDERLLEARLTPVKRVEVPDVGEGECLVTCGGFEDRAEEALLRVVGASGAKLRIALVEYLPENEENRAEKMLHLAQQAGHSVTRLVYDRRRPGEGGRRIKEFLAEFDRVVVDVSGMSRLLIVQIVVSVIRELRKSLTIIYSEAERYLPSQEEFGRDSERVRGVQSTSFLSSGIIEVAATAELSSTAMLGAPVRLIAFPSFDPAQLSNVVQEVQPAYTDVIHGVPYRPENRWRKEAIQLLNGGAIKHIAGARHLQASTMDYRETIRTIAEIYAEKGMLDRIVVSPTGSKMQAVAVGIVRAVLRDIQVVYPIPQKFSKAEDYTEGVLDLYELCVEEGSIAW